MTSVGQVITIKNNFATVMYEPETNEERGFLIEFEASSGPRIVIGLLQMTLCIYIYLFTNNNILGSKLFINDPST